MPPVKKNTVVKNYFILPCCLLLLNVCNSLVSYKAGGVISDPILRVFVVIFMVLVGSSIVAYFVAPAIEGVVRSLYKSSEKSAGGLGQIVFLLALGVGVFFLYYQLNIHGPESLLPAGWRN